MAIPSQVLTLVTVRVIDRVGTLARIARGLAKAGVNVQGFIADASGIHIVTNQPVPAQAAIHALGVPSSTTAVQRADIPDRPGALAELCEKLAGVGVNILLGVGTGNGFAGRIYLQLSDMAVASPILASLARPQGAAAAKAARPTTKKPKAAGKARKPAKVARKPARAKAKKSR